MDPDPHLLSFPDSHSKCGSENEESKEKNIEKKGRKLVILPILFLKI